VLWEGTAEEVTVKENTLYKKENKTSKWRVKSETSST
jgi:hypothetical protein